MIKKKGQTIRLDTPNTTMVLRADTAEYLYYGQRLVSNGDLAALPGSGRHFLSTFGSEDYSEYSLLLQGGGFAQTSYFQKRACLRPSRRSRGFLPPSGRGRRWSSNTRTPPRAFPCSYILPPMTTATSSRSPRASSTARARTCASAA